jgi:hypothetical protein
MAAASELGRASQAHDVAAVHRLLGPSVTIGGLWFEDASCLHQFPVAGEVLPAARDELARCIAGLGLATYGRTSALPDVAVLHYGSGIEVEARFAYDDGRPRLTWIGYVARRDLRDGLPTVTPDVFERHRIPDAAALPPAPDDDDFAWLKVCVDASGTVTGVHAREASTPAAARRFAEIARSWKFQPFVMRGQPQPVCSVVLLGDPTTTREGKEHPRDLPLPLPDEPVELTLLPSKALGKRVRGEDQIKPNESDAKAIYRSGSTRIAAFEYCIDETGRVSKLLMFRSTGLPGYDQKLSAGIRQWQYRPYLDDGKPVPVCSSVLFIYSQR